jgi:hypothetical protein
MWVLAIFTAQILRADTAAATVLQLVYRNRLMIRDEANDWAIVRDSSAIHASAGLDNVGLDNLAWCVEIASDRSHERPDGT